MCKYLDPRCCSKTTWAVEKVQVRMQISQSRVRIQSKGTWDSKGETMSSIKVSPSKVWKGSHKGPVVPEVHEIS